MRDGLSLLDQAIVFGAGQVNADDVRNMLGWTAQQPIIALLQALAETNVHQLLSIIAELNDLVSRFQTCTGTVDPAVTSTRVDSV